MLALKEPTLRVVAVIAEGVPESDAKRLISAASAANKLLLGPATVGGLQAGAFRIGDAAGTIENIVECGLHTRGSVGFVSKSGGMSNECYSVLSRATDGLYEGVAIGGDSFPGSTLSDHALRYEAMPGVKMIVVLGVRLKLKSLDFEENFDFGVFSRLFLRHFFIFFLLFFDLLLSPFPSSGANSGQQSEEAFLISFERQRQRSEEAFLLFLHSLSLSSFSLLDLLSLSKSSLSL